MQIIQALLGDDLFLFNIINTKLTFNDIASMNKKDKKYFWMTVYIGLWKD